MVGDMEPIMRPSDLEDADLSATEGELIAAADEGRIVCEPAGSDALWRPPRANEAVATEVAAEVAA
jgi:hypothetical protein